MTVETYTLSRVEAAYVVASIRYMLDGPTDRLLQRDRDILVAVMTRLAAPMELSPDVRDHISAGE